MSINLTRHELEEITGRVKYSAQLKWLRNNGFMALRRADGMPLVSRAHFDAKMSGTDSKQERTKPDYKALA